MRWVNIISRDRFVSRRVRPGSRPWRVAVELLASRRLLATGFLQGYAYDDANGNNTFDLGESPKVGITITLLNTDTSAGASTTTNADGYYRFNNLVPGHYRVSESSPSGQNANADIGTVVNPATAVDTASGQAIAVTVLDPSTQEITVTRNPDPYPSASAYFILNASANNAIGPFNQMTGTNGDTVHQYDHSLAGNQGNVHRIYSNCSDLLNGILPGA